MSGADGVVDTLAAPGGEVEEGELSTTPQLTPEEWVTAKIEVRDVAEMQAFGRTAVKTYYNVYVNDTCYRGYRYSEINKLKGVVKKIHPEHMKSAPKYPEKGLSIGAASAALVESRRKLFGPWLDHCSKSIKITSSEEWQQFVETQPDYNEIESELASKVAELSKINEKEWNETANKKGVKVHTLKQQDSKLHVVRTSVTVNIPMNQVLETYNTKSEWTHWQPDLKVCKTLELIQGEKETSLPVKEVLYAAYRVPVLSDRDVCLFAHRFKGTPTNRNEPGVVTSLSMSMRHPACPGVRGLVRGELNVGVTYFKEIDGGKACTVTSILHMDPRGLIPPAVINTMAAHTVSAIVNMKDYMEKKHAAPK
eukprot:m.188071 g.188071  ORF g.188071 m.188071 type:complete len:366 (+) comp17289_c0_seq1:115-1212(+)